MNITYNLTYAEIPKLFNTMKTGGPIQNLEEYYSEIHPGKEISITNVPDYGYKVEIKETKNETTNN